MPTQELHLLLADDTPEHLRLLEHALTRHGSNIHVTTVTSGRDLMAKLAQQRFDCAIVDFNLSDMTVAQLFDDQAERLRNLPVVVISSSREQEVVIDSMRCGVVDFIPKMKAINQDILWQHVWMAVEAARRKQRLRHRAERRVRQLAAMTETDPLTGLSNRRHFDRLLQENHWRNDRRQQLCCMMIDIDHFKSINDRLGHSVGDIVLRHVSQSIRLQMDASDCLVRWGGEEFLVITPRQDMTLSWILAQDLGTALTAGTRGLLPDGQQVTASIGLHCTTADQFNLSSIEMADQALYLAKQQGRYRVCTTDMVKLHQLAENAARSNLDTLTGRYQQWLIWVNPMLGTTQWDHVYEHGRHVAHLASEIAQQMQLPAEECDRLRLAGWMHDIGKACLPEELLAKPGPLNEDEQKLINLRFELGASLAQSLGADQSVRQYMKQFNRQPISDQPLLETDSTPSPNTGMSILAIADALAAMTSHRPYSHKRSLTTALNEVCRLQSQDYDPQVIGVLSQDGGQWLRLVA